MKNKTSLFKFGFGTADGMVRKESWVRNNNMLFGRRYLSDSIEYAESIGIDLLSLMAFHKGCQSVGRTLGSWGDATSPSIANDQQQNKIEFDEFGVDKDSIFEISYDGARFDVTIIGKNSEENERRLSSNFLAHRLSDAVTFHASPAVYVENLGFKQGPWDAGQILESKEGIELDQLSPLPTNYRLSDVYRRLFTGDSTNYSFQFDQYNRAMFTKPSSFASIHQLNCMRTYPLHFDSLSPARAIIPLYDIYTIRFGETPEYTYVVGNDTAYKLVQIDYLNLQDVIRFFLCTAMAHKNKPDIVNAMVRISLAVIGRTVTYITEKTVRMYVSSNSLNMSKSLVGSLKESTLAYLLFSSRLRLNKSDRTLNCVSNMYGFGSMTTTPSRKMIDRVISKKCLEL